MDSDKTTAGASDSSTSPLSGMLSTLLSNPEILGQLQSLLGSISGKPSDEGTGGAQTPPAAQTGSADVGGTVPSAGAASVDGLASVLANPELMAKLPQMMAVLKPMLGTDLPKSLSGVGHSKSSEDYRNDLLLALKPFLSPERRNAVDAMLRISKLGNVLRQIT